MEVVKSFYVKAEHEPMEAALQSRYLVVSFVQEAWVVLRNFARGRFLFRIERLEVQ